MHTTTLHKNLLKPVKEPAEIKWWIAIGVATSLFGWGIYSSYITVKYGIGTWGLDNTVGWGMAITNFVWWVGIGHAGTFISAILLLFRQKWRIAINRAAETMTLIAVICAALFPIIHMGRTPFFFYTFPYPNGRNLWVNFNSPLLWDVFAISTYFIVSLIFWYSGLIPDMKYRRRFNFLRNKRRLNENINQGWKGTPQQWKTHKNFTFYLACIAAPLVISVHTIVSMDFSTSIIPGWHSTLFPPYFVAGAIFSGFAMVQVLLIISRELMPIKAYVKKSHIESMNKIILAMSCLVGMAYMIELYTALYHGNIYEEHLFRYRLNGPHRMIFITMWIANFLLPQLLWIKKLRQAIGFTFFLSILINVGMWCERFIIVVTSLEHDYLPSSWTIYKPSVIEFGIFAGTIGLFLLLFLGFTRVFPIISMNEISNNHD